MRNGKVVFRAAALLLLWINLTTVTVSANPLDKLRQKYLDDQSMHYLKQLWDAQTLDQLQKGRLVVPDALINDFLNASVTDQSAVKQIQYASKEKNQIEVKAVTREMGDILLRAELRHLQHNAEQSQATFYVTDKKMPSHPILSWIFGRLSLGMLVKLFGTIDTGENINIELQGNTVQMDFHKALYASKLAKVQVAGVKLLDMLQIKNAMTYDGYLELELAVQVPKSLLQILHAPVPNSKAI